MPQYRQPWKAPHPPVHPRRRPATTPISPAGSQRWDERVFAPDRKRKPATPLHPLETKKRPPHWIAAIIGGVPPPRPSPPSPAACVSPWNDPRRHAHRPPRVAPNRTQKQVILTLSGGHAPHRMALDEGPCRPPTWPQNAVLPQPTPHRHKQNLLLSMESQEVCVQEVCVPGSPVSRRKPSMQFSPLHSRMRVQSSSSQPQATHAFSPKTHQPTSIRSENRASHGPRTQSPSFLVATIRPNRSQHHPPGLELRKRRPPHHLRQRHPQRHRPQSPYGVHARQIVDAPPMVQQRTLRHQRRNRDEARRFPAFSSSSTCTGQLLADRFPPRPPSRNPRPAHLRHHRRQRRPFANPRQARGGSKQRRKTPEASASASSKPQNLSLSDLALNLNLYEDRPVIDRTALEGQNTTSPSSGPTTSSQDVSKDVSKENEKQRPHPPSSPP